MAQNLVDITLVPVQNNVLEVRLRPTSDFDGVCSSIVFSLRWSAASGATLGAVQQTPQQQEILDISAVGGVQTDGPYRYQIYFGMSFVALSDIPYVMQGGQEFPLFSVPVLNGQDAFAIVNDAWTLANNADYYISLNGVDSTGEIYGITTTMSGGPQELGPTFSAGPNPAAAFTAITLSARTPVLVPLRLTNATGQVVWSESVAAGPAATTRMIDLRGMAPGVYHLHGEWPEGRRALRIVRQ